MSLARSSKSTDYNAGAPALCKDSGIVGTQGKVCSNYLGNIVGAVFHVRETAEHLLSSCSSWHKAFCSLFSSEFDKYNLS